MRGFKLIAILLLCFIILGFLPNITQIEADTPAGFFPVGTDFELNDRTVYFVNTRAEFQDINNDRNGIYLIMNDIDMAGTHIEGISTFTGIIFGFGNTISNMRYDGDNLIATTNGGVVEGLNFTNILIDTPNTNNPNGFLFQSNNGKIRNITYSLTNTTGSSMIPPMINSNNDTVDNIIGTYDIEADIEENFYFYTALSDTSDRVNDFWMKGAVNVSTAGTFYYRSMGSRSSTNRCVDAVNVNIGTYQAINSSYGLRCYYSTADRTTTANGDTINLGNAVSNLADDTAVVNLLDGFFGSTFWNFSTTTMSLKRTNNTGIAGEHVISLRDDSQRSYSLNLYQAPQFNSNQLNYEEFVRNFSSDNRRLFQEAVSYSTNYQRVLINGESAPRSDTIERFEEITMRLESDFNLPSLEIKFTIYPELNFENNDIVEVGFNPTTSLGFMTKDDAFLFTDEPLSQEGQYTIKVLYGEDELEFAITVIPIIEGVVPNMQTVQPVTPIITAASVTINGEDFRPGVTFTKVGTYDVEFERLPSQNFTFFINPNTAFMPIDDSRFAEQFTINNNFSNLTVNGITYNENFIQSQSAIIVATGATIQLNLDYGRHRIEISGINGFNEVINRNNQPEILKVTNPTSNHIDIKVVGADLYIDQEIVETGRITLSNVGQYDMEISYPESGFNIDAGQVIESETLVVDPIVEGFVSGVAYDGSVTPIITGLGMDIRLNDAPVDLEDLNQSFSVPGAYNILISGANQYRNSYRFIIRVVDNIEDTIFYSEVPIEVSSPENTLEYESTFDFYEDSSQQFANKITVSQVGKYRIRTVDTSGRTITIDQFEIFPYEKEIFHTDDSLILDVEMIHPDVQLKINGKVIGSEDGRYRYEAAGRYDIVFETLNQESIFNENSYIISPQFDRPIEAETNVVVRYTITNDFEAFYINDRLIENEVFLRSQEFSVNQNGENTIRIIGVNEEEFTYISLFNNPHFNNVSRLSIFAIITGTLSLASIIGRYLLAVRRDN